MMSSTSSPSTQWFDAATRWTQLTFVEDDPLHFDLDAWRDIMQRTRSNAICLSAGGYIGYYPSKVPHHYLSKHLGDRDLFGEVVEVARSLGMKVMARIDPHAIHDAAARANPDWVAIDAHGDRLAHATHPGVWLTCVHSTFYSEFVTEISEEIVREYDVEAVFSNRWDGSSLLSYSDPARTAFRSETGLELPLQPWTDPAWDEYMAFRNRRLNSLLRTWDDAVRDVRPDARFIPNRGPDPLRDLDPDVADRVVPFVVIDKQGRWGDQAIWSAGQVGKRNSGALPERSVTLITSVGPEQHEHRWKDSVDTSAELEVALADGILHEANPWFTKFNARIVDDRWVAPVERAFALHEKIEPHYRTSVAVGDVLLVDASGPLDGPVTIESFFARPREEDGIYQALIEARIPFGYVPARDLTPDRVANAQVIIIPDAARISDAQASVLEHFVASGGHLIATDRTSLKDETGAERGDFALGALLGIRRAGERRKNVRNNYIQIMDRTHRAAQGFEGAARIIGGTEIIPITAIGDAEVPFRFVPDFPDLPMEEVYPREEARDPAVVTRVHPSGGRTAYVSFNIGAIFWEALQHDHGRLLSNLVDWALVEERAVRVEGIGLVDIAVRQRDEGLLIGLVNLDNALSMRGQLHWLRPLDAQTVHIRIPEDAAPHSVRLIVAEETLDYTVDGDRVVISVPPIEVLELLDIRWSPAPLSRSESSE